MVHSPCIRSFTAALQSAIMRFCSRSAKRSSFNSSRKWVLQSSSLSVRVIWFRVVRTISELSMMIRLYCAIMIPVAARSCSSEMLSGCDGALVNTSAAHSALSLPFAKSLNTSITFHTFESVFCPYRASQSASLGTVPRLWNIHTSIAVSCP